MHKQTVITRKNNQKSYNAKNQAIGRLFKTLRETRGWDEVKLSSELSWPTDKVTAYERGDTELYVEEIIEIAMALNIEVSVLFQLIHYACTHHGLNDEHYGNSKPH